MINEQLRQIKEIIESNGRCPSNTLCDICICKPLLLQRCNPESAIEYIKETYLNIVKIIIEPTLAEKAYERNVYSGNIE